MTSTVADLLSASVTSETANECNAEACGENGTTACGKNAGDGPAANSVSVHDVSTTDSATSPSDDAGINISSFLDEINNLPKQEHTAPKKRMLPGFLFDDGQAQSLSPIEKGGEARDEFSEIIRNARGVTTSTGPIGTGKEECDRLLALDASMTNYFEFLHLTPSASDEDIKRAYKKISLVIHPDKCDHANANEAFQVLTKAYEEVQKPNARQKYNQVINEAKKRVLKEITKENKKRAAAGGKEPSLATSDEAIQERVIQVCEELVKEMQQNAEYADRCRKANEEYENRVEAEQRAEERQKLEHRRKWEATRDTRVAEWCDFKRNVETKRVKLAATQPLIHHREQRKPGDKTVPNSKPAGIDESYKLNWR